MRESIIGGLLVTQEDGAKWANMIWKGSEPLPADHAHTTTDMLCIDEDEQAKGATDVRTRTPGARTQCYYIVVTQIEEEGYINDAEDTSETVLDPNLQFKEGELEDEARKRLKAIGEWLLSFRAQRQI